MKNKTAATALLVGIVAWLATWQYGRAETPTPESSIKIGVVSVRGALSGSKRYVQARAQALKRQSLARAQIEDLTKEIEAEEAEIKTLKEGTPDYMKQLQTVLEKRAKLQTQQEYLKQERVLEDKRSMEDLYQEVLKIVRVLGKEKGLDMVLGRTEPEFPISSEELMLTLNTDRVLYVNGAVDLTREVIARLDAGEATAPEARP